MKKVVQLALLIGLGLIAVRPISAVDMEQKRQELEARRQQRLEQLFDRQEEITAQVQVRSQEGDQAKEEFRLRLEEIKSERKRQILLNLDEAYARINQRWTTHFNNALNHLETILGKINVRAENDGQDVQDKIEAAYRLIEAAREKVAVQAAKVYTVEITDEAGLRDDAKKVHRQLRADLTALRAEIKVAREAIHDILKLMAGAATTPGAKTTPEPEITAEPEPTNVISQSVSATSEDGRASATAKSVVIINNE